MKSNVKKIWIGILILAIACLATIACVIGVKASNVVDENILNLEENADTVAETVYVPVPEMIKTITYYNGKEQAPDLSWFEDTGYEYRITVSPKRTPTPSGSHYSCTLSLPVTSGITYYWDDGTRGQKTFNWFIRVIAFTQQEFMNQTNIAYTFNGNFIKLKFVVHDVDITDCLEFSGVADALEAGVYSATVCLANEHRAYFKEENNFLSYGLSVEWRILPIALDKPTLVTNSLIYNGSQQNVALNNFDFNTMYIYGNAGINVRLYTVTISLKDSRNYCWDDGESRDVDLEWSITPKAVAKPTFVAGQSFTYNGNAQTIKLNSYDTTAINITGNTPQTNAGTYSMIVSLISTNYKWNDNTTNSFALNWTISPKSLTKPSIKSNLTYTGSQQTVSFNNFDTATMNASGNTGTDAKSYTATLSLRDTNNYVWSGGNSANFTLTWKIDPKAVAKPTLVANQSFTYNGNSQTIRLNTYDNTAINITGTSATNAGSYSVTASLKSTQNYKWSDNTTTSVLLRWTISPKAISKPSLTGSLTYNGSEQTIAINNFDAATMNVSGNTGTNAGSYTATISLKSTTNYKWSDNTNDNFTLKWTIGRKGVAQPTALANNVFVHTGSNFTYIPNGFDASQMNIQGNVQTEVGKYTASVTPNSNHMWSNGTTTAVTFSFEIIPAGITLRQNVYVDYIYNDNGTRKSYGVTYRHKLNDSELNIVNGETRYILGNIKAGTSIGDFLQSLLTDSNLLVIKDIKGNVFYDGLNNIADLNKLVATGYEVILYKDNTGAEILDRVYLSVLGDLTGDGQINSADMAMLNRILSHEIDITSYSLELQLATMLNNNGMLSSIDREIMHNIVKDIDDTDNYFGDKELTSDYVIFELNGNTRVNKTLTASSLVQGAVVGNISQGTTASAFVSKMQAQGINISLSDMHRANNANLNANDIVGTGCYFTYNGNKIYLTILGDLTGDGSVNSQDRLVINKVVSGSKKFDDMITAVKLACLINNNGSVTSTDSEIIWQSIVGEIDINHYVD